MATSNLVLEPQRWWGWLELPVRHPGWGASPVFITSVQPLGTGKGLLRLGFVHAVRPVAAARRSVDLRVVHRTPSHLVGTFAEADGQTRTAILAVADFDWLASFCRPLLRRRPPTLPSIQIAGQPPQAPTAQHYLAATLGADEQVALSGATAGGLGASLPPMPERNAEFALDLAFEPFQSWLIARGRVPGEMEEKWRVYLDEGRLLFRRSWTGNLIYEVEAAWQGDRLRLGRVRVNRDPAQYKETSDERDRRLLGYLIAVVLLGEQAPFPAKDGTPPEQAALEAWSVAGKASL